MINEIEIICDRCGKTVHGIVIEASAGIPKVTGGFYDVANPSVWGEFALTPLETSVCDQCMWADPRFLIRYPGNRKFSSDVVPTTAPLLDENTVERIRDAGVARRDQLDKSPKYLEAKAKVQETHLKNLEKEAKAKETKDPKPPKKK